MVIFLRNLKIQLYYRLQVNIGIIKIAKTFINGLASSYDNSYNPKLRGRISEKEFNYIMNKLNEELLMLWPCCFCFLYGYVMSLCTLGNSFFINFTRIVIHFARSLRFTSQNNIIRKYRKI